MRAYGTTIDAPGERHEHIDGPAKGLCAVTEEEVVGDCLRGESGTRHVGEGGITNLAGCRQMCLACVRCSFVSFSVLNADCSWYSLCDINNLQPPPNTAPDYLTVYVKAPGAVRPNVEVHLGAQQQPPSLSLVLADSDATPISLLLEHARLVANYNVSGAALDLSTSRSEGCKPLLSRVEFPASLRVGCMQRPNVGREAGAALDWLTQHYDSLPQTLVFAACGRRDNYNRLARVHRLLLEVESNPHHLRHPFPRAFSRRALL